MQCEVLNKIRIFFNRLIIFIQYAKFLQCCNLKMFFKYVNMLIASKCYENDKIYEYRQTFVDMLFYMYKAKRLYKSHDITDRFTGLYIYNQVQINYLEYVKEYTAEELEILNNNEYPDEYLDLQIYHDLIMQFTDFYKLNKLF